MARSKRSNFSSNLLFPRIPPNAVTRSFTPSSLLTFSLAVSNLMIFLNALPSHNIAARGDRRARCSFGHKPAKNSSLREYSLISVSPGQNAGVTAHGRCDSEVCPPVPEPVDEAVVPGLVGIPVSLSNILDQGLPEANKLCQKSTSSRGSSATSVELVAGPLAIPFHLQIVNGDPLIPKRSRSLDGCAHTVRSVSGPP